MNTYRCPACPALLLCVERFVLDSTDGPIEHAHITCTNRHYFTILVEDLAKLRSVHQ